jgi:hypothetical protein
MLFFCFCGFSSFFVWWIDIYMSLLTHSFTHSFIYSTHPHFSFSFHISSSFSWFLCFFFSFVVFVCFLLLSLLCDFSFFVFLYGIPLSIVFYIFFPFPFNNSSPHSFVPPYPSRLLTNTIFPIHFPTYMLLLPISIVFFCLWLFFSLFVCLAVWFLFVLSILFGFCVLLFLVYFFFFGFCFFLLQTCKQKPIRQPFSFAAPVHTVLFALCSLFSFFSLFQLVSHFHSLSLSLSFCGVHWPPSSRIVVSSPLVYHISRLLALSLFFCRSVSIRLLFLSSMHPSVPFFRIPSVLSF